LIRALFYLNYLFLKEVKSFELLDTKTYQIINLLERAAGFIQACQVVFVPVEDFLIWPYPLISLPGRLI
jgi:hypothetical protein